MKMGETQVLNKYKNKLTGQIVKAWVTKTQVERLNFRYGEPKWEQIG